MNPPRNPGHQKGARHPQLTPRGDNLHLCILSTPGARAQPLLLQDFPGRMQTGARQQGTAQKFPSPSAQPLEMLNKAFENRPCMELSPISQRFGEQYCYLVPVRLACAGQLWWMLVKI